jgi:hypothetical protein
MGSEEDRAVTPAGLLQAACALTLGMAGGWAVHEMFILFGWPL